MYRQGDLLLVAADVAEGVGEAILCAPGPIRWLLLRAARLAHGILR